MKRLTSALAAGILFIHPVSAAEPPDRWAIVETYADIAHAVYEDAWIQARALQQAVEALIRQPGEDTLAAAREAWRAARVPYQQSEVYRFGNAVVDAWEGKVNAWPLDEGLIDYVAAADGAESGENPLYAANVIANPSLKLGARTIDAARISKELLAETLHELGGIEANVATGYHAVEFLLWGQDLNGTGPGSGNRPWTDYAGAGCTHGHCGRRAEYLQAAAALLVDDLAWMTAQWAAGGQAREALLNGEADAGLTAILTGLGSLAYGELAGERMRLGLMLHDPEEEQDCFSDNTHNAHYHNVRGMLNVYTGTYTRSDGSKRIGLGLAHLLAQAAPRLNREMHEKLQATEAAANALRQRAETVEAYDQMIGPDNPEGNAVVQAVIDALTAQTRTLERIVAALNLAPIAFEGSDSLDNPEAVFQ